MIGKTISHYKVLSAKAGWNADWDEKLLIRNQLFDAIHGVFRQNWNDERKDIG